MHLKTVLLFFPFLFTTTAFSQVYGVIKNQENNKPVPYVNIWIYDTNTGTSSNEKGEFTITTSSNSQKIVFSAIGFKTKTMQADSINNTVVLVPQVIQMNEIVVTNKPKAEQLVVGKLKNEVWRGCSSLPFIKAVYFAYSNKYDKTPYLKSIRVLTNSNIEGAMFNVRLYSVDDNGGPGNFICSEIITGFAKKGQHKTVVNLSGYNIILPENGVFIAIEWLVIDENKYEYSYKDSELKVHSEYHYDPKIGMTVSDDDQNGWIFHSGKWHKETPFKNDRFYPGKYGNLAIELTLMN